MMCENQTTVQGLLTHFSLISRCSSLTRPFPSRKPRGRKESLPASSPCLRRRYSNRRRRHRPPPEASSPLLLVYCAGRSNRIRTRNEAVFCYLYSIKDGTGPGSTRGPGKTSRFGFTRNRKAETRFYTKRGNRGTVSFKMTHIEAKSIKNCLRYDPKFD